MMIAPKKALQNPPASKPGTIPLTSFSMSAFTTRMKKPRVTRMKGRLSKSSTGRMKALTMPRSSAVQMSAVRPLACIGVRYTATATATLEHNQRMRNGFMRAG